MNKKGFTLIELLVVIAILGLLSTLAVVALGSAREKARDSKRLSDLKQVQTALELYYTDQGAYPTATAAVTLGSEAAACLNGSTAGWTTTGCTSPYMGQVPKDPSTGYSYVYGITTGSTYEILASLEGVVGDLNKTIKLTPAGIADVPVTP
ncbi:MAG: prepilin-type N-terminal cleavage/methylation domain-containing protein [Patescibacteria group bacterium]|nr:prepilin-type N-terminal cleavage/methylation domain-containing protein [Patescibacteria group bacterium]